MKFTSLLFAFFITLNSFSQYSNIDGLQKLDSADICSNLTSFGISVGEGHYSFELSSNETFIRTEYTCYQLRDTLRGTWTIFNNKLYLKSGNYQLSYTVFKLTDFYFLISETQETSFLSDILKARAVFKDRKSIKFEDTIITREQLICLYLHETYPAKIPEEVTGT